MYVFIEKFCREILAMATPYQGVIISQNNRSRWVGLLGVLIVGATLITLIVLLNWPRR